MKPTLARLVAATWFATAAAQPVLAQEVAPWRQYATPAEAGFSSEDLAKARAIAEAADSAAVFVIYRGHVLLAWGDVERRFKCHSVRKSLLSGLIGIHAGAQRIDLEETLESLGIDDRQALSKSEKEARVVDLLCARSGVYHPAAKEPSDMQANRPARHSHAPGTHWWYNNWDFNTLLTIYEGQTGERVYEDFRQRIAEPIGMQDYRIEEMLYQLEPSKSIHPAYAFRMSARDLARFGELYRLEGRWGERQVIPASWIAESTRAHSVFETGAGYGYMWWTHAAGSLGESYPTLRELDSFSARGTGGQFVLVVPDAEFVFVHRGDTDNDRRVSGGSIWKMADLILGALEDDPKPQPKLQWVEAIPFANPGPLPKTYEQQPLDAQRIQSYVGEYEMGPGVTFRVHVYEDRLFVNSPRGEAELFSAGGHHYFCRAVSVEAEFIPDDTGAIRGVRVVVEGREGEGRRL